MATCPMVCDDSLSAERGNPGRPYVYRCPKCGFVTAPTSFADPARVRRNCKWFDPAKPGFTVADPCWCKGLGDVLTFVIRRAMPERLATSCGRLIDRLETWLTGREQERHANDGGCGGCQKRRVTLNTKFPLLRLRRKICPPQVTLAEAQGDPIPVCFSFAHGFGDAVQFTAVLRHLQKHRPLWRMSIYCKAGAHSLFDGLVERVGVIDRPDMPQVYRDDFALVHPVRWLEPVETFNDSPATKVERCLREEFGITPEPELLRYTVRTGQAEQALARRSLAEISERRADGRFKVVAIHYQGNSWRTSKNLDEAIVRDVICRVRAAGYTPLIVDFEPGYRSSILKENTRGVKCFGHDHPLWKGLGVGDGRAMLALLEQVSLIVGIDSGPEHLAAATNTPTLVVWGKRSHPVNYFCPAPNVTHVVRRDQGKHIFGDRETGERYFAANYRYHELDKHLRLALPELVEQELNSHATCPA